MEAHVLVINMMWGIFFLLALVVVKGEPVTNLQRNGEFNRYYLSNRLTLYEQLDFNTASKNIINNVVTVVIVHGHQATHQTSLNPDLRREFLEIEEDVNVISVDWSIYAALSYSLAESSVLSVGEHLATFLDNQNIKPELIHLIGFNLGAHIVGVAGRRLGGVARITGLDPSRSNIRLSNTDAGYVEVIHTDGSGIFSNGLGVKLGHADFYPNGGSYQPGCWGGHECSHNRAWLYFAASIRDNTFSAKCCNTILEKDLNTCRGTTLPMGNNSLIKFPCASGIYRVNTRSSYPY